jgi:hypothetical protein
MYAEGRVGTLDNSSAIDSIDNILPRIRVSTSEL